MSGPDARYSWDDLQRAVWLATAQLNTRASVDTVLTRMITVFDATQPHHVYLFANKRANRIEVQVHDITGI